MRVQLSKEWATGSIQPYGNTKEQRLRALRKKIYQHRDSPSHKSAETVLAQAKTERIETVVAENNREQFDSTCKVFRTMYYVYMIGDENIHQIDSIVPTANRLKAFKIPGIMKIHQVRSKDSESSLEHRVLVQR